MKRLPMTVEELRGVRAARWVRESTPGQFDRYGPEAQVELQDRAIVRLGLVDSGLMWRAAHSGRTVYRSVEMEAMLAAAVRGEFDVLLVGYVSRWQRNLHRTLELLDDKLHPVGVPVYFADEDISELRQTGTGTSSSARRRTPSGPAGGSPAGSKRAMPASWPRSGTRAGIHRSVSGGMRPSSWSPTRRRSRPSLRCTSCRSRDCRTGRWQERTGIGLYTVRGVLTSPLYAGRLRDGTRAHWDSLVPDALWETVRSARAQRATNAGGKADPRRPYALDMLHCAGCRKRLTGDSGYYRHREPCPAFVAARPGERRGRGRWNGHAYRKELYEEVVEGLLGEMALGAGTLTRVVAATAGFGAGPDRRELDRIDRERTRATTRYLRDRDTARLDATMRELDRAAEGARTPKTGSAIPADVAVRYLRDLPDTWRAADGGPGQQLLASALFSRIEVLGLQEATVHLTDHAVRHGVATALTG